MPDIVLTPLNWLDVVNDTIYADNSTPSYGPLPSGSGSSSDSATGGPGTGASALARLSARVSGNLDYAAIPSGKAIFKVKLRVEYTCGMSAASSAGGSFDLCSASTQIAINSTLSGTSYPVSVDAAGSNGQGNVNPASASLGLNTFAVLRSDVTPSKEFRPRAFNVFGPKVIATRYAFEDSALESRCLTEFMKAKAPRGDIPGSLSPEFDSEAAVLRNRLFAYRVAHYDRERDVKPVRDGSMTPRRAQILAALLSVAVEDSAKTRMIVALPDESSDMVWRYRRHHRTHRVGRLVVSATYCQRPCMCLPIAAHEDDGAKQALRELFRQRLRAECGSCQCLAAPRSASAVCRALDQMRPTDLPSERDVFFEATLVVPIWQP